MCLSFVNSSVKELTTFRSYSYIYAHTYTKKNIQHKNSLKSENRQHVDLNLIAFSMSILISQKRNGSLQFILRLAS